MAARIADMTAETVEALAKFALTGPTVKAARADAELRARGYHFCRTARAYVVNH